MLQVDSFLPISMNILQIFFQLNIVISFFVHRCKHWATFLCSVLIGFLYFTNPWIMLGVFYLSTFLYYFFIVKMRLSTCLLAIAAHYALTCMVSNLLTLIYFGLSLMPNKLLDTMMKFAALVLYILLYAAVRRFHINTGQKIQSQVIVTLSICLLFVSFMSYFVRNAFQEMVDGPRIIQIISCLVIFGIQAIVIYMLVRINNYVTRIERLEMQQLYIDTLESSHNKLRGFKHDFNNILNTMAGYVALKRHDELGEYIDKIQWELVSISTVDVANTTLREAPFLYGIILSKLQVAEIRRVQFYLNVMATEFEVNTLNVVELSRIVGNLLDNAIEAALNSEDMYITVDLANRGHKLEITISNPFVGEVDLEKIFASRYTTKKGHMGYGLHEVRQTLYGYQSKGIDVKFDVTAKGGLFTAYLLV